ASGGNARRHASSERDSAGDLRPGPPDLFEAAPQAVPAIFPRPSWRTGPDRRPVPAPRRPAGSPFPPDIPHIPQKSVRPCTRDACLDVPWLAWTCCGLLATPLGRLNCHDLQSLAILSEPVTIPPSKGVGSTPFGH